MRVLLPTLLLLSSLPALAGPKSFAPAVEIKVDQVGYLPAAPKVALVVSGRTTGEFIVRRVGDGKVVLRGTLAPAARDVTSGDSVQAADFTRLKKNGGFYLDVPGVGVSWPFRIGDDVYARAYYLAMRSFYGQRCGTAVDLGPEFPGYRHDACHTGNAFHATSGKSGTKALGNTGWHDAGDYGRYVVNSGLSTGTLLWTYEMFGSRVRDVRLGLPESGSGTPDILNEIRWNLDWMLSMQDEDGGVFHKQTSERFCGFVMPERDEFTSFVIGTGQAPFTSSCATADFSAVMAIAARVYTPFDRAFAAKALDASRKAFAWVNAHPATAFTNPTGIETGAYGDRDCSDEALWAVAELWRTTREEAYERRFVELHAKQVPQVTASNPPSWASVAPMGLWTYVLAGGGGAPAAAIREASMAAADSIVARTTASGYRHGLEETDFVWGSNGVAANYGLQLLVANALKPDPRYREAAADQLHYLLGRNTFSVSWVTQVGANPVRHPHHRPSGADQNAEPWPGLLSGGPNRRKQDPAMQKMPDLPPAKMFVDDQESYASNETAINWNAPLVFLLAAQLPEVTRAAWAPPHENSCRFCGR
jgi:endoglucanase